MQGLRKGCVRAGQQPRRSSARPVAPHCETATGVEALEQACVGSSANACIGRQSSRRLLRQGRHAPPPGHCNCTPWRLRPLRARKAPRPRIAPALLTLAVLPYRVKLAGNRPYGAYMCSGATLWPRLQMGPRARAVPLPAELGTVVGCAGGAASHPGRATAPAGTTRGRRRLGQLPPPKAARRCFALCQDFVTGG